MKAVLGSCMRYFFFFQAEDGIRDLTVTGVQTCALPICVGEHHPAVDVADDHAGRQIRERRLELPLETAHRLREPSVVKRQADSAREHLRDRKSTRLNSSHSQISYAVFCLKKKHNMYSCS